MSYVLPHKNFDKNILAFHQAKASIPDLRYFIIGHHENKYAEKALPKLLKSLGLTFVYCDGKGWQQSSADVVFIQNLPEQELVQIFQMSDRFLSLSLSLSLSEHEGFGVPFVDAALAGVPSVLAEVGVAGFLSRKLDTVFCCQNSDQAAKGIIRFITANKRNSAHSLLADFSEEDRLKETLYTQLLGAASRQSSLNRERRLNLS